MQSKKMRRGGVPGMAVAAVIWTTSACERVNPNYVGGVDLTSGKDLAGAIMVDLTSGKDLANGPLCGQAIGMVQVTGGSFQMGADDLNDKEKPPHLQTVTGFWMDETEVTVDAYGRCVAAEACTAAEVGPLCNVGVLGKEQHPINCVDVYQAQAYCRWQCKRLPTEIEWEYAARGSRGSLFPWGNELPNTVNKKETDLCWKMSGAGTCAVKSYPQSATLLGAVAGGGMYDLAGNVWEWTTSHWSCSYPLNKDKPDDPSICGQVNDMSATVIRGGSYGDIGLPFGRAAFRNYVGPTNRNDFVGFRCLRTP